MLLLLRRGGGDASEQDRSGKQQRRHANVRRVVRSTTRPELRDTADFGLTSASSGAAFQRRLAV